MKVLKFGGTSIGNENQIRKVVSYLRKLNDDNIVVFSALSDITNYLSEFVKQSKEGDYVVAEQMILLIEERHKRIIAGLLQSQNFKNLALKKLNNSLRFLQNVLRQKNWEKKEKEIMAQGELLSCMVIYLYMLDLGIDTGYLDACTFMKLDKSGEPDYKFIQKRLAREISRLKGCKIYITNGYICIDNKKKISNLGRGGSDYTATIIAKVMDAEKVEIWTDIDGFQNNDPRYVDETFPLCHLSYDEAAELAYFGAKILHPASIAPARQSNIPIVIKNSMNFFASGTLINNYPSSRRLTAVAAKDGITIIKIKSGRMLQAYGFLRKIFEIFEKYKTPVDMLTTSEISVAMTIDNCTHITGIVEHLKKLGEVEVVYEQSIICIVGDFESQKNIVLGQIVEGLDS
ncbi:MAG TPA: aspartate kinase, partial [Bacteroidales bacterium]|nr:aspartate kinase [Bacteroidales bacterium]